MNVRLDYRHINYWQRTLGCRDRTLSSGPGAGIHAQEASREMRAQAASELQQRAPNAGAQSLRYPRR